MLAEILEDPAVQAEFNARSEHDRIAYIAHAKWVASAHRYQIPPPLPSSLAPTGPDHASGDHGGEGVDQPHGRDNWDKTNQNGQNLQYGCTTTPAVQILQCSPVATAGVVPLAVEADLLHLLNL